MKQMMIEDLGSDQVLMCISAVSLNVDRDQGW